MAQRISAWTELHSTVAVTVVVICLALLVGLMEPPPYSFIVAGAIATTAVVALALDPLGGLVAGLAGAAAVIAAKQLSGAWTADTFWTSLAETTAFLVVGVVAGWLAVRLRRADTPATDATTTFGPAYGSLGLLPADVARARLEDEVDRSSRHRRPLTLLVVQSRLTDGSISSEGVEAAYRSVARLLESRLRATDVPFALTRDRLGAILVETDRAGAWQVAGPLLESVHDTRFTTRSDGRTHELADVLDLDIGIATLGTRVCSAAGMLDLAIASITPREVQS